VNYLIDTSALFRILRNQADSRWDDLAERGQVAICEPVLVEALTIADAKRYNQVESEIRDTYPWVPVPDDAWQVVRSIRTEPAAQSQHHGLSVADHLVADHLVGATAIRWKLVVLHEDAGFTTVARIVPELRQERLGQL
jgi:predicted nucleic acid-binding protein